MIALLFVAAFPTGTIMHEPFVVKHAILREIEGWHSLIFSSAPSSGGPCRQPYAPDDALYLNVTPKAPQRTFPVGQRIATEDLNVLYRGKKGPVIGGLQIDKLDVQGERASGLLEIVAEDGTNVSGEFSIPFCYDRMIAQASGGTIHGVTWGRTPATLPSEPAQAQLGGKSSAPIVAAVVGERPAVAGFSHPATWTVYLYTETPPNPCATHDGRGSATPGISVAFGKLREGPVIVARRFTDNDLGKVEQFVRTVTVPRKDDPIRISGAGVVSLTIDRVDKTKKRVRGRVSVFGEDPSKSMVVGSFDAILCPAAN